MLAVDVVAPFECRVCGAITEHEPQAVTNAYFGVAPVVCDGCGFEGAIEDLGAILFYEREAWARADLADRATWPPPLTVAGVLAA